MVQKLYRATKLDISLILSTLINMKKMPLQLGILDFYRKSGGGRK